VQKFKKKMEQKFIEKAHKELGEDENKRQHCLEQLREWILKSPICNGVRQGEKSVKHDLVCVILQFASQTSDCLSFLVLILF
jgi:hypothetical protein